MQKLLICISIFCLASCCSKRNNSTPLYTAAQFTDQIAHALDQMDAMGITYYSQEERKMGEGKDPEVIGKWRKPESFTLRLSMSEDKILVIYKGVWTPKRIIDEWEVVYVSDGFDRYNMLDAKNEHMMKNVLSLILKPVITPDDILLPTVIDMQNPQQDGAPEPLKRPSDL